MRHLLASKLYIATLSAKSTHITAKVRLLHHQKSPLTVEDDVAFTNPKVMAFECDQP